MSNKFSRRDFLKLTGVGAATTAVLTGCGPASRYTKREPYMQMPEYTYNGHSTYYATTCRECAAGCGLIVRTSQGRAIKTEGNANNPLNLGKTCARGQATLHGLYNPDRVTDPMKGGSAMTWDEATQVVADALKNNKPGEIAFLMGLAPDHLFDFVSDLASATGINAPVRFNALDMFDAQATLSKAAENLFGQSGMPLFDVAGAQFVLSFGANFLETWLSPVSYTRGFAGLREAKTKMRGKFIQFEARMSATAAKADEWMPAKPGTEALVALAIGKLAAEIKGGSMPRAFSDVEPKDAAEKSGIKLETLEHIAEMFAHSGGALAIPGGAALGQSNGLAVAEAVLALNALADNFGKAGGVYFSAVAPTQSAAMGQRGASAQQMQEFIQNMKDGKYKVLFIHGANPVFELPAAMGFKEAMKGVEQVISFSTFPDETAAEATYVFPDHHGLESWGYQRVFTGAAQSVLSGLQPVVSPFYNTRATVDVLLAAGQIAGGKFAMSFMDEVEFLRGKIAPLMSESDGLFSAPDLNTFMAYFQQHGGWWKTTDGRTAPATADVLSKSLKATEAEFAGEGEFFFVPFVSPTLAEAGANKPWLQELPDPTTTVMWNSWVAINPETAHELGVDNNDVVKVISEFGEVEVSVYKYPAIRPDTIAIPYGQGHTAYGRYAANRGVNPADLLGANFNEAGDLAFAGVKVKVEKTGKKSVISRLESMMGVYGVGMGEEH
jgi:anaerobic selenocysteine-containing dehydrogenase